MPMECAGTGAPIYYNYENMVNASINPSTMHAKNTGLALYFARYLLQKAISVFKWKLPDNWKREGANYFLYTLYCWGFNCILNTDKYGAIPQGCGLRGYNIFYQPTTAIVTNPLLRGMRELRIGRDCTLFRLQPDYGGIMDIVYYYADLLALCAEATGTNLMNIKLSYVFTANNKTAAEAFKKLFDRIASGEPAVVQDKNMLMEDGSPAWQAFQQNLNQVYVADRTLSDMRKIEAMFDTEIGIPNANTDKRERLITDEVNANNVETASRVDMWLDNLKECCEQANAMFGTDMSVDWRFNPYAVDTSATMEEEVDSE